MMKKKIFTLLLALMAVVAVAEAQKVTFTKLVLQKNQVYNNRKQMRLNYSFDVSGAKGHRLMLYAYIYCTRSDIHKYANGKQMFKTSDVMKCNNNINSFNNGWEGFFYDELNPLSGTRTYYIKAFVKDLTTKKWIGSSKFIEFKMQGRGGNTPNTHTQPTQPTQPVQPVQPVQPTEPQRVEVQVTCTYCNGSGLEWSGNCLHDHVGTNSITYVPEVYCQACRKTHCSECQRHDNCYHCDGKGYRIEYKYR